MRPAAGRAPTRRGRWTRGGRGGGGGGGARPARVVGAGAQASPGAHRRGQARVTRCKSPSGRRHSSAPPAELRNGGVGGATATREIEHRGSIGGLRVAVLLAARGGQLRSWLLRLWGGLCVCPVWSGGGWRCTSIGGGRAPPPPWSGRRCRKKQHPAPRGGARGCVGRAFEFSSPVASWAPRPGPAPSLGLLAVQRVCCVGWGKTCRRCPPVCPHPPPRSSTPTPVTRHGYLCPSPLPPSPSSTAAADGTLSPFVGRVPLCPACPVPHPRAPLRPGSARPGASPPHHPSPHFPAQRRVAAARLD